MYLMIELGKNKIIGWIIIYHFLNFMDNLMNITTNTIMVHHI